MNVVTVRGTFLLWSLGVFNPPVAISPQDRSPAQPSIGQEAVGVVLKHHAKNTLAVNPRTGKPFSASGQWSIAKTAPPVCPQKADAPCVEVFYQVPADALRCSWVVLLDGDGKDGGFLDESEECGRYLLRTVVGAEASSLVNIRKKPTYPPIAEAAHVSGDVTLSIIVSPAGEVEKLSLISGPAMLRASALDAARAWTFKPLTVGTKGVPYQMNLVFTFQTRGPHSSNISMAP